MADTDKFVALLEDIIRKMIPLPDKGTTTPVKGVVSDPVAGTMSFNGKTYIYFYDARLRLQSGDVAVFVPLGNSTFFAVGKV